MFNADSGAYGRWFDGATCNTCYNCVDRHVLAGRIIASFCNEKHRPAI
ncbi:hypothetical protein [Monaibacterium marinum]|nr:hypothetical protein [Monaibacterium marinum]